MKVSTDGAKIEHLLKHQVVDVFGVDELRGKLISGKKRLRIKLGADPSRPDLHLGHAVVLRKLKEFLDLGHQAIFIIGDFTAGIGDPSGKSKTRPMLSEKEIKKNSNTYLKQVSKVLGPQSLSAKGAKFKRYLIVRNASWLNELNATDVIKLVAKFTIARILERNDFETRYKNHVDIHMHELLYPIFQAQDSIELDSDVEIGATEQMFNMLAGRELAQKLEKPAQAVITCPILVGTDGKEKMSKSLNNYIGITDSPDTMFGKTMSIPDEALDNWIELATDYSSEEVETEKTALKSGENPREIKARLAKRIVQMYWGEKVATLAANSFDSRFRKREMPTESELRLFYFDKILHSKKQASAKLYELVAWAFGLSNSQARRDIESGGVKIDSQTMKDPVMEIAKGGFVLQKGKLHFVKVV